MHKLTDDEWKQLRDAYPKRSGGQGWPKARIAANRRIFDGATFDQLRAGVVRYFIWCEATHNIGSQFVMQAVRFFGPGEYYDEDWEVTGNHDAEKTTLDHNVDAARSFLRRVK